MCLLRRILASIRLKCWEVVRYLLTTYTFCGPRPKKSLKLWTIVPYVRVGIPTYGNNAVAWTVLLLYQIGTIVLTRFYLLLFSQFNSVRNARALDVPPRATNTPFKC